MCESEGSQEFTDLLDKLRAHLPQVRERYGVSALGLFDSYIREEQRAASDLDILVEYDDTPTLLEFIDLQYHLSDLLGVKVDLVMRRALKPAIGRQILEQVVPV